MHRLILALSTTFVGLAASVASGQAERFDDDRVEAEQHGWIFDYAAAKQKAKTTNRPLMVVIRCVP